MMRAQAILSGLWLASVATITPAIAQSPTPAPYHTVGRIAGGDGGWDFSALDAASGRLYIARTDAVSVADIPTGSVTTLAPAHKGHQVLVLDHGATVFQTDGATGLARFIDAHSGAILAEVPVGTDPDAALFDYATGLVAVMNAGDGTISLIDPVKRVAVGRITVGGGLEFAVADGAGTLFVNIEDGNAIARVDLVGRKLLGRIALPGCEGPTGLALVSGSSRLITACANKVALVVNAASGAIMATLPIGEGPDAVLADEPRGLAFVPCGGSGTLVELSILDRDHIAVAGTIPTQTSARSGAIDPGTGRIYLPVARFDPPPPGKKRGAMVPGSFAVLVLAPGA
jgi:DNA-binding beta-propeller fold protein YncE